MTHNLRTFYTIILTQTFSMIGSRISSLAVGMWIFAQTGEATPLALVTFFTTLPMVIASSLSGVLADRYDRRHVMVLADIGQAAGTLLLLLSFASGSFEVWHLYVVTVIQSLFGVFQGPAFSAAVTTLVPDEHRDRANAIQQITGPSAGIIAPIIAGFVYAAVGVTGAIVVDLMTFLVAIVVILSIHIPRPVETDEGRATRTSVWKEVMGGMTYFWSRRPLLFLSLYVSMINFLFGGSMALITPYLLSRTGSTETMGLILGALNLGGLAGGILMGVWGGTRPRIHTIMPGIFIMGVFISLLGMGQSAPVLGLAMFFMLFPAPFVNASFMSIMQVKVPPDLQGRVFAALHQVSIMLMPISALLVGPLADNVVEPMVNQPGWERFGALVGNTPGSGMGLIYFVAGIGAMLTTLVIYSIPRIRNIESILPDYKLKNEPVEQEEQEKLVAEVVPVA